MASVMVSRKNLGRYREIATVLARHGFGWLFVDSPLRSLLPLSQRLGGAGEDGSVSRPAHLRLAFEELGAAFVKVGQLLSTRQDLLPPGYIAELAKLQDAAPPAPYAGVAAALEAELGAPPEKVFAAFDPEPLAAASLGQVHAARMENGEEVVVKVQRPGVAAAVGRDLDVMLELAAILEGYTGFGRDYDLVGLAEEFAFTLRCELMYTREMENAERFRRAFDGDPAFHVPRVYREYTTDRVIVQERLRGVKADDLAALEAAGIDRKQVAADITRISLEQMFAHGFFHADPHPGNFFVEPDGTIGMVDFGMVGNLDETLQEGLSRLFMALSRGDAGRMTDELLEIGVVRSRVNRTALKRDLAHVVACYKDRPAKDLAASRIFGEITALSRRHRLGLPSDLLLMARVMAITEGIGTRLDPDFVFVDFATPYFKRFWLQRRSPEHVREKVAEGVVEMAGMGLVLSRHLRRFLTQAERGELGAQVELKDMDRAISALQRMVNRLAVSILVGSLIVGLSLSVHMFAPEGIGVYARWFLGLSFGAVAVLGLWLLFSLMRPGRG